MTDELRAKFEEWWEENYFYVHEKLASLKEYAWMGWQAAHASRDAEVEAAKIEISDGLRKLPALWRQIEQSDEPQTEFDKGYEQANRECADNLDAAIEAVAPMLASARLPEVPNEMMLIAAREWSAKKYGKPIGNEDATGCWQAMFAAASKPETEYYTRRNEC